MKNIKNKMRILYVIAAILLLICIAAAGSMITTAFADPIEPSFGNYYFSDFESKSEALKAATLLNEEIYGEGATLLKNESGALPLAGDAKISLFGKNAKSLIHGGSGSGSGGGGQTLTLAQSLNEAGFSLNPALINFYNDNTASGAGRGNAPSNGNISPGYNTGETPVSMYTSDIEKTYAEYGAAALVVISRIGGEGFDLPRTMKWNGKSYGEWGNDVDQKVPGARNMDDHYLQLDQNESDLLKYLGGKFDKVIVLLNTGSQFECGFLDDPGHYGYHENVKAAMWIGYPGGTGIRAIGKVLKGEINPSGKTVDTYARDFKKDPVWMNFGNNLSEGGSATKGNQYANLPGSGGNGGGGYRNNYVNYKEGIYLGYRYYETRGYDERTGAYTGAINGTTTVSWDDWYDAHVVYPFGHGLSYTTFTHEVISQTPSAGSVLTKDGEINVTVRVTNTGDAAGKDVVQLYYTPPYTINGVEKSHVVLGAFEKTTLLAPSASEDLTLKFKVRDMASYDWAGVKNSSYKGYLLESGNYSVKLMRDAHNVIDTIGYSVAQDIRYDTDDATGNPVTNQFDRVSNQIDEYLSRGDWEGTYPETDFRLTADQWIIDEMNEWNNRIADADKNEPYYTEVMPTTGVDSGIKLQDLVGIAYTDPQWQLYLDQFTAEDMRSIARDGSYYSGQGLPHLGITRVHNADGPAGFIYGAPSSTYAFYSSETVLASTWNKELAYEKGKAMGNEALWGDGSNNSRIPGWYAPAVNIHRSPFSGRNFEYYSEDGYLSGMLSAEVVLGAKDKGMFSYVKHFGLNDQETNRCGLLTWANEQSMREIYFKPFELCVKVGNTAGMMSALNRIGGEWVGGSYELLTNVLRKEWGFEGSVVTDTYMGDSSGLSNADQMVRAGGNLALGNSSINYNANTATTITALRNATHGILYAHANSMAMNTAPTPTLPQKIDSFPGGTVKTGVLDAVYRADVGTATISRILYPDADDDDIVYTMDPASNLPAGLELSDDGIISGIPREEMNNHKFTVQATYEGYTKKADFIISIVNSNGSIIYQMDEQLGNVTINKECSIDVAGAEIYKEDASEEEIEKFPPITYSLANGSILPKGLTLSGTGIISGTPVKECEGYEFTVVAGALGYKARSLTFTLSVYNAISFESSTLKNAVYGETYTARIKLAETENSVRYELKEGSALPNGLALTKEGYITGTPSQTAVNHKFTVLAISDYAETQEAEYSITVGLKFDATTSLPDGKVGAGYDTSVNTAQGKGSVKYAFKAGSDKPEGLTLSEDGDLTGKPTKAGVYTLTIVASADGAAEDEITLTLYIANADVATGCSGTVSSAIYIPIAIVALGVLFIAGRPKKLKTDIGEGNSEG